MGSCSICGKEVDYPGSTQHGKKHRREFETDTGYSKHTDFEIIKAFYGSEDAAKWAEDIVDELKAADRIPKNQSLEQFQSRKGGTAENS